MSGGVGGASSARQRPNEGTQVRAEVRARYDQVGNLEVGKVGQDVVESDKGAGCGCPVVVPDVTVMGIFANRRSTCGDEVVLSGSCQVGLGGEV